MTLPTCLEDAIAAWASGKKLEEIQVSKEVTQSLKCAEPSSLNVPMGVQLDHLVSPPTDIESNASPGQAAPVSLAARLANAKRRKIA